MKITFLSNEQINDSYVESLLNRGQNKDDSIDTVVKSIIEDVKQLGDQALLEYTEKFDQVTLSQLKVTDLEMENALKNADSQFLKILEEARDNIETFHEYQIQNTWSKEFSSGVVLGQKVTPIPRVGLYVPGGKGGYPSTVLMGAIPAIVAGVNSIALITPPNKQGQVNPAILIAAKVVGINEIYKVGGAQGIAALAYGTESIQAVNKIVGPGNAYVAAAKKLVFGKVDIDMIAGPSEICIIADKSASPSFIAADMLSQAEHDEMACSILITTEKSLAIETIDQIYIQRQGLSRKDIIKQSIKDNARVFIVDSIDMACRLSNIIAPEHLELAIEEPMESLDKIVNAGAIFLGHYTPEPVGDYFAGPNHTLPTSGTAKFSSPLGVYDFVKKSSIISYEKGSLEKVKDQVIEFAQIEGFDAHANAIRRRFEDD